MKEDKKHTPLPWRWDEPLAHADLNKRMLAHIRLSSEPTSGGVLMAGAGVSYLVNDDERTNGILRAYIEVEPEDADFIVRACNSHYELVEALNAIASDCEALLDGADMAGMSTDDLLAAFYKTARAAIAKAKP